MPYVKSTVHFPRIASTALKSFTHGYAQTVVAASQSSYAAQNTQPSGIADSLIGRFQKSKQNKIQSAFQHADTTRHAGSNSRSESKEQDSGLGKYLDAWQKHQQPGTKEWQQVQFAKRVEWQPPTTIPTKTQEVADLKDTIEEVDEAVSAPVLKRSYTTSALDNFGRAFIDDEAAEAAALEQVNNAIAEEIQKSKDESIAAEVARQSPASDLSAHQISEASIIDSSETSFTSAETIPDVQAQVDLIGEQLLQLVQSKRHGDVPAIFKDMLRAGVQQPSPAAYRALLSAAIEMTPGKYQKVPKALEVYSDMLRRKVVPDVETYSILIEILSNRAVESFTTRQSLEKRVHRYGGLEENGKFMFQSNEHEYAMIIEDNSLTIALKMFERAARTTASGLSGEACAALVAASAQQGRVEDMTRIFDYMQDNGIVEYSQVFAPMIGAFGAVGDLRAAVETYDYYKELAIANNDNKNAIVRVDNDVYAALIKAYGSADRLKGGLKFLASIQAEIASPKDMEALRATVALDALLPLALKDASLRDAVDLTNSMSGQALNSALTTITIAAADRNLVELSIQTFDHLSRQTRDLAEPSMALLAMHVRNANVEAAEPFWRILEAAPASVAFIEPTTMRAVALIGLGQAERALRQSRRLFGRIREAQVESRQIETAEQIDEAIELIGSFVLKRQQSFSPDASAEMLRMMVENGGLVRPLAHHLVAAFGPEHIARLNAADLELLLRIQAGMIFDESLIDIAGPARFGCLLENVISRSIMPSAETETMIEKTLVNIDRTELSRLWNSYRYPSTPSPFAAAPFTPVVAPSVPASFEDSFDPYAGRTDVKGSNMINDLLDRPQGRRMTEALAKFRNMRRTGRVPRMFTYGKLIESAAKENNITLAHDILEMAKQDVTFDARYRVVRFGWQQILDHMISGCLNAGRRDLASKYHDDLLEMGAAPSANTFGLYITTLKENTKTFDEATEAVKIFHRAKAEGVEPSSFLYNALIGKLGKARRIDDCLFYFAEMRNLGIRPTSVTYGTIVNALCRVSDEKFAEEIFEEMESCTNYKPRPAPYHSLMQYFLTTKRDRAKVLAYYERMRSKNIAPTVHTFKLLIDTHATLEPINMPAAEAVLHEMKASSVIPEAVHYASLIHAKGCVQHDLAGAQALFDSVQADPSVRMAPCIYQAMFESLNANHRAAECEPLLADMAARGVEFTPYIANALIHGWTLEGKVEKAKAAFERVPVARREPSTYEAMVRAFLAAEDRDAAKGVVREALGRGYPSAVAGKIAELVR